MRAKLSLAAAWWLVAVTAAGCKPDLGARASLVNGPRILGVRGMPAEAAESDSVTYDMLAVDTGGTVAAPDIGWAQCLIPDPPAEGNDVNPDCLTIPDDAGPSATFTAAVAMNACMVFGPETPAPMNGQPPTRPADPDTSGGYYQPVRAVWQTTGLIAFALQRIQCPLVNAPGPDAFTYAMQYQPNNNPALADLLMDPAGAATPIYVPGQPGAPAATVAANRPIMLQADFTPESPETFLLWDVVQSKLVEQRESLRVSWYATAGAFDHDVTGRTSAETELYAQNLWTAPATPGPVHLWAVLRDSRGGIDFASAEIDVTP